MATLKIPVRFDAMSAPEIEEKALQLITREKPASLCCDFSETLYISSAGLRVALVLAKRMKSTGGECLFQNLSRDVYDIFRIAGFHTVLNIEAPKA